MKTRHCWRATLSVALAAAVVATLAAPTVALAAAAFSSRKPASGSSSLTTKPRISVYVYDRYGIKGAASFSMTIDGKTVKPKYTYKKARDYRGVTVWFQVVTALKPGAHTFYVKVKDTKKKSYSIKWKSTVLSPPPTPTSLEMPVPGVACLDCHTGYPAAHPMSTCSGCHSPSSPPRPGGGAMRAYGPLDASAHTLGCALTACHRGGGTFPHALDADCARCHTGATGIPPVHALPLGSYHGSTSTFCTNTGCHLASLTKEHYRHASGGAPLTCATCHSSADPKTVAAIASRSTACEACHDFASSGHPNAEAGHTTAATACTVSGCHTGRADSIHAGSASGCAACHGATGTLTAVCTACHPAGRYHTALPLAHTVASVSCTVVGCHPGGTDVSVIHAIQGCSTCHVPGRPATSVCATAGCHTGNATSLHNSHPATISAGPISIRGTSYGTHRCSECHATTELQALHGGKTGCAKCHPTPRKSFASWGKGCVQGGCHATGTTLAMHGAIDTAHTIASAPSCSASDCHTGGTDLAKMHAAQGCATCHVVGKTATSVCATTGCHGSTATHPASDPHPAMTTGHTAGLSAACVKSGCHAADLAALHRPAALGCATCHATGKTATKDCAVAACHPHAVESADLHPTYAAGHNAKTGGCVATGCHIANVIALHTIGTTPPGCAACHAPGKPALTTVCSTVGCHNTGAPSSHNGHPTTVTSSVLTILGTGYGTHLCSECHAAELQSLHGGATGCSKCHPAPRSTFTTWTKGCVQGGCHASGTTLAMHGSIDSAHRVAATGCTTTGCHKGGFDVASIHALHGCATCHKPGKTATVVCTTSGCHENGASAVHSAHPASVTGGSFTILGASYGTHSCTECHATELQAAHGGPTSCSKCHPTPRTSFQTWGKTCVQGGCHQAGSALAMHGSLDASHKLASAPSCVATDCHAGGVSAAAIHGAAGGPGCAACHGAGKTTTLVCDTPLCHGATDPHPITLPHPKMTAGHTTGLSATCAKTGCHASDLATLHRPAALGCATCHASGKTATKDCAAAACHPHPVESTDLHPRYTLGHNALPAPACILGGCHTGGTNVISIHVAQGCVACHAMGKPKLTVVCTTSGCHGAGVPAVHSAHPASVTSGSFSILGASYGTHSCTECHTTELQAAHGGATGCSKCHPTPRTSFQTWGKTCVQGSCHQAGSTLAMHGSIDASHKLASTPSCVATDCHTGGVSAAAIHAAAGGPGCAACHGAGKTTTLVCDTPLCHGATDAHPITVPHPKMAAGHTTGLSATCVKVGCHATDLATLHRPAALGCATCHGGTKVPTKDCAVTGCHPYSVSSTVLHPTYLSGHTAPLDGCVRTDCHSGTRVTSLHATHGCAVCHSGRPLTIVCATSGCHSSSDTHPQADPHPKMTAGHTTALSATCVKAGCHAADLAALHTPALGCATCHAAGKTASKDCAVSGCHPYAVDSTLLHPTYASAHALAAVPSCVGSVCHPGSSDVAGLHTLGATPPGCEACHAADRPPLTTACATAQCHDTGLAAMHPSPGHGVRVHPCTDAGCHATNAVVIHEQSSQSCGACHAGGPADTNACSDCHPTPWATRHAVYARTSDYHGGKVGYGYNDWGWYSDGWILAPYARGVSMPCATCHVQTGTTNLYDFPLVVNGRQVSVTTGTEMANMCYACHGGTIDDWHAGCFGCHAGGMGGGGLPTTMVGRDCSSCHQHGMPSWPHGRFRMTGATL